MNKEAILNALDSQLDKWCAEKIHGWQRDIHEWYRDTAIWTWKEGTEEKDIAVWQYTPTSNDKQAKTLLPLVATEWRIEGNTKGKWSVSIKSNRGDPTTERIKWYHGEANSMAKAIVLACLSAIAEMESQP